VHPSILDACLQITAYKPYHRDFNQDVYYLPAGVDAVILHQPAKANYFPQHIYAHLKLSRWSPSSFPLKLLVTPLILNLFRLHDIQHRPHGSHWPCPLHACEHGGRETSDCTQASDFRSFGDRLAIHPANCEDVERRYVRKVRDPSISGIIRPT
jgi:hypothetical protein